MMKQFRTILGFELQNYFKNKVFVSMTIIFMLAVAGIMFYPRVSSFFTRNMGSGKSDRPTMLVATDSAEVPGSTVEAMFKGVFPDYRVKATTDRTAQIKEQVKSGKAKCAFVIGDTTYTYYVNGLSMSDNNATKASSVVKDLIPAKNAPAQWSLG